MNGTCILFWPFQRSKEENSAQSGSSQCNTNNEGRKPFSLWYWFNTRNGDTKFEWKYSIQFEYDGSLNSCKSRTNFLKNNGKTYFKNLWHYSFGSEICIPHMMIGIVFVFSIFLRYFTKRFFQISSLDRSS